MSKQIDWSQPLSDADRTWAGQFSIHHPLIAVIDEQHAGATDESLAGPSMASGRPNEEGVPPYEEWLVPQLKEECDARDISYSSKPNKQELITLLEADDAADADEKPPAE